MAQVETMASDLGINITQIGEINAGTGVKCYMQSQEVELAQAKKTTKRGEGKERRKPRGEDCTFHMKMIEHCRESGIVASTTRTAADDLSTL